MDIQQAGILEISSWQQGLHILEEINWFHHLLKEDLAPLQRQEAEQNIRKWIWMLKEVDWIVRFADDGYIFDVAAMTACGSIPAGYQTTEKLPVVVVTEW